MRQSLQPSRLARIRPSLPGNCRSCCNWMHECAKWKWLDPGSSTFVCSHRSGCRWFAMRWRTEPALAARMPAKAAGLTWNLSLPTRPAPLHVGHVRGAVFGDSLGRLLEFTGFEVVREYYVNDCGAQVDALARSAYLRYLEANGQVVEFGDADYQGEYLKDVGDSLKDNYGDGLVGRPESEWIDEVRTHAIESIMEVVREDLELLGVDMDIFFSEKSLHDRNMVASALDELEQRGLIYEGILEPPKGNIPDDWEPRETDAVQGDGPWRRR